MELARPFAVITPTLDGDVLAVLAGAEAEFTSGQVHRLLPGRSQPGIVKVLDRLSSQGIVTRRQAGRVNLYRLNGQHLAAPHVLALARLRQALIERVVDAITGWRFRPVYGALFGSVLGRAHRADSDIDLFLVRPDDVDEDIWDEQTEQLASQVTAWTGNDARILEMAESRVRATGAKEPVLKDIVAGGVVIAGPHDWLASAAREPQRRSTRGKDDG